MDELTVASLFSEFNQSSHSESEESSESQRKEEENGARDENPYNCSGEPVEAFLVMMAVDVMKEAREGGWLETGDDMPDEIYHTIVFNCFMRHLKGKHRYTIPKSKIKKENIDKMCKLIGNQIEKMMSCLDEEEEEEEMIADDGCSHREIALDKHSKITSESQLMGKLSDELPIENDVASMPAAPNDMHVIQMEKENDVASMPAVPNDMHAIQIEEENDVASMPAVPNDMHAIQIEEENDVASIPAVPNDMHAIQIEKENAHAKENEKHEDGSDKKYTVDESSRKDKTENATFIDGCGESVKTQNKRECSDASENDLSFFFDESCGIMVSTPQKQLDRQSPVMAADLQECSTAARLLDSSKDDADELNNLKGVILKLEDQVEEKTRADKKLQELQEEYDNQAKEHKKEVASKKAKWNELVACFNETKVKLRNSELKNQKLQSVSEKEMEELSRKKAESRALLDTMGQRMNSLVESRDLLTDVPPHWQAFMLEMFSSFRNWTEEEGSNHLDNYFEMAKTAPTLAKVFHPPTISEMVGPSAPEQTGVLSKCLSDLSHLTGMTAPPVSTGNTPTSVQQQNTVQANTTMSANQPCLTEGAVGPADPQTYATVSTTSLADTKLKTTEASAKEQPHHINNYEQHDDLSTAAACERPNSRPQPVNRMTTLRKGGTVTPFQKIVDKLAERHPHQSIDYLQESIKKFKEERHGLSGMKFSDIVDNVSALIEKDEASKAVKQWNLPQDRANHAAIDEQDNCPICHETLHTAVINGVKEMLECQHSFHKKCIREWFKKNQTCPVCRVYCKPTDEYPALPLR